MVKHKTIRKAALYNFIQSETIILLLTFIFIVPSFLIFKNLTIEFPNNQKLPYFFPSQPENFLIIVNLVRPKYLWIDQETNTLKAQVKEIEDLGLESTWLLAYDNILDEELVNVFKNVKGEVGAFIEVSPKLAEDSHVAYKEDIGDYYYPNKVFLPAYTRQERDKLIETYLSKYKEVFGIYPTSVGAWYIDARTQEKLSKKGIKSALTVSDQYETDSLSIWGKYLSFPYYPSNKYSLEPAKYLNNKITIVNIQWAQRDPISSYGKEVKYSRQSLQANDYIANGYDTTYFEKLLNTYLNNKKTDFNQITIGLEIGQESYKFKDEYSKQLKLVSRLVKKGILKTTNMQNFAQFYSTKYPNLSPPHFLKKDDDFWFMNRNFRVWISKENDTFYIKDLRFYENKLNKDYLYADPSQLLVRRVEGTIDDLVKNNKLELGTAQNIQTEAFNDGLKIFLDEKEVKITNEGVFINSEHILKRVPSRDSLLRLIGLKTFKNTIDFISNNLSLVKYSRLDNKVILGFMLKDNLFGLYGKVLGIHKFEYSLSSNFLTPGDLIEKLQLW